MCGATSGDEPRVMFNETSTQFLSAELAYRRESVTQGIARSRRGRSRAAWARSVAKAEKSQRNLAS